VCVCVRAHVWVVVVCMHAHKETHKDMSKNFLSCFTDFIFKEHCSMK